MRRIGAVVQYWRSCAGCGCQTGIEETTTSLAAADRGRRHARAGPRDRERGLHLRLSDRRQLPGPVLVLRRQGRSRVQGRLERDPQHRTGVHARGQGDPDPELRYAVLRGGCRPARRAAGADGAADRAGPLLLAAVRRCLHLQLRLRRQPHHRQRRRQIPAGRAELEGRQAGGRQRGHPLRHRAGLRAVPHPAVRPVRHRQRQEDPGRLPGSRRCRCTSTSHRLRPPRRSTSCRR